ncbi:MAG: YbfB/YjiJ family MFS transporter [Pseudomonadota bacterium]
MHGNSWLLAFGGMTAMAAAMGIGRFVYTPILPVMAVDHALSVGATGWIASANFAGYLAGALLASSGRLSGQPRQWLLAALAVNAIGLAMMALSTSLAAFLVWRFIGGLASAFMLVFASALVLERLAAAGRSPLSALHFSGVGIGIAISALAVGFTERAGGDSIAQWGISAVLAGAGLAAVYVLVPNASAGSAAPSAGNGASFRPNPALSRMIAAYGLFGFGYIITATFLVAIVRADPAMAAVEPTIWLVFGLVAAPSVLVWTRLSERVGVPAAFALAAAVEAVGVAATVLWPTSSGALLGAVLLGGTFMGLTALGLMAARSLTTGNPRSSLGLMTAAFGFGQIVGPVFAGLVHERTASFTLPSLVAAGTLVLSAALALTVRRAHT